MKFFLTLLISLTAMSLTAQIQLKVFFEQDTVMIGDTVGLNYQILVMPDTEITAMDLSPLDSVFTMEQIQAAVSDTSINWEDIFDAKAQFEILNYGMWTPSEADGLIPASRLRWKEEEGAQGGQKILSNRVTAVFWDEGHFVIPNPKVGYRVGNRAGVFAQPGTGNQVYVSVPTVVDISEVDTLTQLTPIKPILEESRNWKDFLWLYIIFGVVIFGALLYRYLTKEEEIEEVEPEIILPPHVIALQKLEDLKKAELWQKGDVKEYQTRLTYTLREYLENRYDMQALESTTAQINEELRKSDVAEGWRNKLRDLLQVADLVKFAKAEPEEEFHARVLNEAVEFVEETKEEEVIEEPTNDQE
ncbi:MAG: hypothetical protein ACI85O_001727 [Saprospiraceae bacterium]|jgi:hypothetical protein